MSWMSDRTGRPKEEGGHRRINISVDEGTFGALCSSDNRSQYIEYCINSSVFSKRVRLCETHTTASDDCQVFTTALCLDWVPRDSQNNAILSACCYFRYKCTGKGFRFRIGVNERFSLSIAVSASGDWDSSCVYSSFRFEKDEGILPNQESYSIRFEFRPADDSSFASVMDINVILDVVDGMAAWNTFKT